MLAFSLLKSALNLLELVLVLALYPLELVLVLALYPLELVLVLALHPLQFCIDKFIDSGESWQWRYNCNDSLNRW
ncbi:hypothetical protein JOM56_012030 [Amanita muscaria]